MNEFGNDRLICDVLMTTYEDRTCKAWFEYAEPGLLTNRTIRNFLNSYSQEKWPDVVKLTLLYGIVTLRQSMGVTFVPLEKIRQKISRLETAYCVEEKLLPIQEKVQDLKGDVQQILESFAEDASIPNKRSNRVPESDPDPTGKRPKPRDDNYVLSSLSGPTNPTNIYPEWWGDGSNEQKEEEKHKPIKKLVPQRSPPRLCYFVPREHTCVDLVDDMVEPKYSLVQPAYMRQVNDAKPQIIIEDSPTECNKKELRTVANIAESFLDNKWTAELCKTIPASPTRTSPTIAETVNENTSPRRNARDLNSSPPRSTSFWIDLTPVPEKQEPTVRSPNRGVVLDFGHLDSPRFPPKGFKSSRLRSSTSNATPTEESNESVKLEAMLRSVTPSSSSPPQTFGLDAYSTASETSDSADSI